MLLLDISLSLFAPSVQPALALHEGSMKGEEKSIPTPMNQNNSLVSVSTAHLDGETLSESGVSNKKKKEKRKTAPQEGLEPGPLNPKCNALIH